MTKIGQRRMSAIIRLEAIRQLKVALFNFETIFPRDSLKKLLFTLFCEEDIGSHIPKLKCWRYFGDYQVHLALLEAVSVTYIPDCVERWQELFQLYVDMIDYGEQFSNISKSHFRATVITGLGHVLAYGMRSFVKEGNVKIYMDILSKQLSADFAFPSHKYCVTASVLQSIAKLVQVGILTDVPISLYLSYGHDDNEHVRLAGISALLSFLTQYEIAEDALKEVLNYIVNSEVPATIRCHGVILMTEKLETIKGEKNKYVNKTLKHLFEKYRDIISKLTTVNNPACLQTSVWELLQVINKLTVV